MLIYPDLTTYRKIYSESAKQALDDNETVLLITTYDSFDKINDSLTQVGVSVSKETKEEGNLVILLEYERSLQKRFDIRLKGTCTYHKDDFATLPKEQQETIISAHNRVLV